MKRAHLTFRPWALLAMLALAISPALAQRPRKPEPKPPAPAEPAGKPCPFPKPDAPTHRLIQKDGGYQPVSKCEVIGDRVHYLSAERFVWEDIPYELIDWDATGKYDEQQASDQADNNRQLSAEAKAEQAEEEAKSPQVAPGLRLPDSGGVWLLDTWRGDPQLVELVQNGGEINKNTGRNILRAAINPLAKAKQTIVVKGSHARVQAHVAEPELYINVDQDSDPSTGPAAADVSQHYRIVRLQPLKNARAVGDIEIAVYGKVSQKAKTVATRAAVFSGAWVRIVPDVPLEPGEYALVEMLGKEINMYVWDFGVNPMAPQNDTAWHPVTPGVNKTGTDATPVLKKPIKH